MPTRSYLGQNDIIRFLSTKNGLSEATAKRVLHDICDAVLIGLLSKEFSNAADLPRLGRFSLETKGVKRQVAFRPSRTRIEFLETCGAMQTIPETPVETLLEQEPPLAEDEATTNSSYSELEFIADEPAPEESENNELTPEYLRSYANKSACGQQSNAPDTVRTSFTNYLREDFPYGQHWKHPITGMVFNHDLVKRRLEEYRVYNKGNYRALWCLWTTQQSRAFIAEHFNFSGSSIKRRWNRGIDTLIVMLMYPNLMPQVAINLYSDRM